MKENKNGETQDTNQKAFWVVGIALIVFLILVFGSIVGLRITKNGINDILGKTDDIEGGNSTAGQANYEVWEDGTKENVSKGVVNAEFNIEGVHISNCTILERDNVSEISLDVQNTTEESVGAKTFLVKLFDADEKMITEFTMLTNDLEPGYPTIVRVLSMESCANAASVKVELVNVEAPVVSGE